MFHDVPWSSLSPVNVPMRALVRWYISYRNIICKIYVLPCAAAARSETNTRYTSCIAADLNAFFLCEKKMARKKWHLSKMTFSSIFQQYGQAFSKNRGFFVVSPVFCCLGCLSRYLLDTVCLGVKVPSPDIFALKSLSAGREGAPKVSRAEPRRRRNYRKS